MMMHSVTSPHGRVAGQAIAILGSGSMNCTDRDVVMRVRGRGDAPKAGFSPRRDASTLPRSEKHTSELQSIMRISYADFCLKKKTNIYGNLISPNQIQRKV